jgi:hypothetical protein
MAGSLFRPSLPQPPAKAGRQASTVLASAGEDGENQWQKEEPDDIVKKKHR